MKMHLYANCLPAKGFGILLSLSCNPGPHGSTRYLSTTAATAWLSLGKKTLLIGQWKIKNKLKTSSICFLLLSALVLRSRAWLSPSAAPLYSNLCGVMKKKNCSNLVFYLYSCLEFSFKKCTPTKKTLPVSICRGLLEENSCAPASSSPVLKLVYSYIFMHPISVFQWRVEWGSNVFFQ